MADGMVKFTGCIQDSQEFGSSEEHMVSRVFFDLEIAGKTVQGLHADLKQVVGSTMAKNSIEVGWPVGYDRRAAFDYDGFASAARDYYLGLVGSTGGAIGIGQGAQVRMSNNRFISQRVFPLVVKERTQEGW